MIALQARGLTMQFGGLKAVSELDLEIPAQSIFGLIGPNGAGKTTAFNLLTGVYRPTSGTISVFGREVTGLRASRITASGIARTFQNIRLFKDLRRRSKISGSLLIMTRPSGGQGSSPRCFAPARCSSRSASSKPVDVSLLALFGLDGARDRTAKNLSYGDSNT